MICDYYFIKKGSLVNKDIYWYSEEDIDIRLSNGDKDSYFPLSINSEITFSKTLSHSLKKVNRVNSIFHDYRVDMIEIDDYYVPIDGITSRKKEFINSVGISHFEAPHSMFIDSEFQNDPI